MKARITVLTIGVNDLNKAVEFYRDGLGLSTQGITGQEFEYGAVAFFDLQNGLRLALWPRKSIAHDSGMPLQPASATEFTLGHNVNSKEEVNEMIKQVQNAGAKIVKAPADTFWGGYAAYFQDPDGHLWEVVWNPEWQQPDE
jgi:catechol 2,3-dioxygenase-like lactoylglutathione lyase family enzyme